MTNMDQLYEAVEARGPVCVGLDTDFSYLPADFVLMTPILPLKKQHMMHPRLILRHPNLNNRLTGLFQIKRRLHLIQNTPQIILPVLIKILHMNPQHLP